MSNLSLRSFTLEQPPPQEFFDLPQRIEGLGEGQAAAERVGTQELLDPTRAYFRNAEALSFLAIRDGRAVGRLTAFHNHLLVTDRVRFGLVGLFACENDVEAARLLVHGASTWLAERQLTAMRGPMAGDIWHRWRFMTRGFETDAFPGEPRNPKWYPELFAACGFAPVRTYSTKKVTNLDAQLARFHAPALLNAKRGIAFRSVDRARWNEDLKHVYELCRHSFASRWSVTETTFEEFSSVYNRWLKRVGSEQIVLATDKSGGVVGLGLAVTAPLDTLNIRTVAVYPHASGFGVGQAIGAELYRRGMTVGVQSVNHCLMGPNTPPQFWDHGLGSVTREYTMYERAID